jgi:hypothetical protein
MSGWVIVIDSCNECLCDVHKKDYSNQLKDASTENCELKM